MEEDSHTSSESADDALDDAIEQLLPEANRSPSDPMPEGLFHGPQYVQRFEYELVFLWNDEVMRFLVNCWCVP